MEQDHHVALEVEAEEWAGHNRVVDPVGIVFVRNAERKFNMREVIPVITSTAPNVVQR